MRRAKAKDAAALARVHVDSWRAAYRGLVPPETLRSFDYPWREDVFRNALAAEAEETYVIELNQEVVGFVTLGAARDEDVEAAVIGEIWGIYITPTYWRKGIGTKALAEAERLLLSRGYHQAVLWVVQGNHQGRRFYESRGYQFDGATMAIEWGKPLTAVRLRKTLILPHESFGA